MAKVKIKWQEISVVEAVIELPDDVQVDLSADEGESVTNALINVLSKEDQPEIVEGPQEIDAESSIQVLEAEAVA